MIVLSFLGAVRLGTDDRDVRGERWVHGGPGGGFVGSESRVPGHIPSSDHAVVGILNGCMLLSDTCCYVVLDTTGVGQYAVKMCRKELERPAARH